MKWDIDQVNMQNLHHGWISLSRSGRADDGRYRLAVAQPGIKMILPQSQTIFRYSGRMPGAGVCADDHPRYLKKFLAQRPNLECHHSSLDTELPRYKHEWRGASPVVEVVSFYDPDAALVPLPHPAPADNPLATAASIPPPSRPDCHPALTV
jgi:hypothetical protein